MKESTVRQIMQEDKWFFLKLKSGNIYRVRIISLDEETLNVIDKFSLPMIIDLNSIEILSQWKEE